jgi:Aspartyl protease/Bacterial Ig domain/Domain of unknown function DUF11
MDSNRLLRALFSKQPRRRSASFRPQLQLLEDRVTPSNLDVPLDPALDQFGDQFETVQAYQNSDGLGDRVTFSIFDTGASPITFGWEDQFLFDLSGQAIPTLPGVDVTASGVGGDLTGLVSEPGTILADGIHALDLNALLSGQDSIDMTNAAAVGNVQAMIGTDVGSPDLPSIVGTPILNGGLGGALSGGVAAMVDMQSFQIDFGALFPDVPEFQGLLLPIPDLSFVSPGTTLTQGVDTTEPVRVPVDFVGIDNSLDPGTTITESFNPVVHGIQVNNTVSGVPATVDNQTFLFDTGAQLTIISTAMAQQLGLDLNNPETTIDIQGAGGTATVPGYTIDSLVVPRDDNNDGVIDGTLKFTSVPVYVLDVDPSLDGILGMNLLDTAAKIIYDPVDPDGAGPAGPSLQFTFSTAPRDAGLDSTTLNALNDLNALLPGFAGTVTGHSLPGFTVNRAPSVAADQAAVTVNEGQTATNTGTFSDPDGNAVQISADIGAVTQNGGAWSWSLPTTDGPLGPITVTITADDGHGGVSTTTFTYAVNDVPPTIAISGAGNVDEGASYALTLGAVTDPGADTVTDYIVHWGDGSSDTYASAGVKTHTYADGPNNYSITVDLQDEDGTHTNAGSLSVTVNDVAPMIALTGNAAVNKLAPYLLQLGAITDPGVDTVTGFRVNWGDGATTGFVAGAPTGQTAQHVYAVGGVNRTITVDLYDEDAAPHLAAGAQTIAVLNAAPNLAVKQTGTPAVVARGGIVRLLITLSNLGNSLATGGYVILQLPVGMTWVALGSTPGWHLIGARRYRLDVGTLQPGQVLKVVFRARVAKTLAAGSLLTTVARVGDDGMNGPDALLANNVSRLTTRVG